MSKLKDIFRTHWKLIVIPSVIVLLVLIALFILTKGQADRPFAYAIN
jgi:Na+/H+-dicarboxylate symporter